MAGGRDRQARLKLAQAAGLAGGIGKPKNGKPACDMARFTYNDDSVVSVTSETASTCSIERTGTVGNIRLSSERMWRIRHPHRDLSIWTSPSPTRLLRFAPHRHIPAFLCMLASKHYRKLLTVVWCRKPNQLTCVESLTQCLAMAVMYGMPIGDVVLLSAVKWQVITLLLSLLIFILPFHPTFFVTLSL